jgi:hypothetical protein
VSKSSEYGAIPSVNSSSPSMKNRTKSTPEPISFAETLMVIVSLTVAELVGVVISTDGATSSSTVKL